VSEVDCSAVFSGFSQEQASATMWPSVMRTICALQYWFEKKILRWWGLRAAAAIYGLSVILGLKENVIRGLKRNSRLFAHRNVHNRVGQNRYRRRVRKARQHAFGSKCKG